jgi:hypothetical protein
MSNEKNPNVEAEVAKYDADEASNLSKAEAFGFDAEQLDVAKGDIAEEREAVVAGEETANQAEANVNRTINEDLNDLDAERDANVG